MSSSIPMGEFQLPLRRRVSRLYNDTKKSSDFVKESVQHAEDPDMKALHHQLRIQKDRLISWGLEWSDPNQSAEIDESISRAGLSDVVAGIMSTIKDTLAAAEPLWQSSIHPVTSKRKPSGDRKVPLVQWDKSRFEHLVRVLTDSIDTLYDLSHTRSSRIEYLPKSKMADKPSSPSLLNPDETRPFESTRMQTPPQINPQTLIHLGAKQQEDAKIPSRQVVSMQQEAYFEMTQSTTTKAACELLLLEYAAFNPIYSATGIMPPMSSLEKLFLGLQKVSRCEFGAWTGLPRLLGYFLDHDNSRIGLIYRLPCFFNPALYDQPTNTSYDLLTLSDLLEWHKEPALEARFSLAYSLASTVFDMHARGLTHGNFCDKNVSFCDSQQRGSKNFSSSVDIRRPLLSSFELFPEERSASKGNLCLDPMGITDERVLELYPLALILLSIGMWVKVDWTRVEETPMSSIISDFRMSEVAAKCGTLYTGAVRVCLDAVDVGLTVTSHGERILSAVQKKVCHFLKTCCVLDDVGSLEHGLAQEPVENLPESLAHEQSAPKKNTTSPSSFPADKKSPLLPPDALAPSPPKLPLSHVTAEKALTQAENQGTQSSIVPSENMPPDVPSPQGKSQKMRLYPHVPIPPQIVDKWNTILMPQVNQCLGHFYRMHPESVEISLESVGPSPHATKPTVVVICSSVRKVRAILKTRLGELFDGSTEFALKVCRGHVVQSRRCAKDGLRSAAHAQKSGFNCHGDAGADDDDDDEIEAVNPEYQECPGNGASIGAWIGDRHLPPVSFGGLVLIDGKPYGMTVHHMLDDPDQEVTQKGTLRSSNASKLGHDWCAKLKESGADEEEFSFDLSDTESDVFSEADMTSEYGADDDDDDDDDDHGEEDWAKGEPGDIPGIEPGCGGGYIVTQPALDDVEEGFYPCAETEDEDHLDTFTLGGVYASSGIRRKRANGLIHEVDWALFEFEDGRLPEDNSMPRWEDEVEAEPEKSSRQGKPSLSHDLDKLRPTTVVPWSSLPGLEVQCIARTSGLRTGRISAALTSVKIYGRCSPSHTYQVTSTPSSNARKSTSSDLPMGIPGDSGAWVVDRRQGQLCGHVLAWSERKRVAYISPMDVVLLDIAQTLDASEVCLPGGGPAVTLRASCHDVQQHAQYLASPAEDADEVVEDMLAAENDATSERVSVDRDMRRGGTETTSAMFIRSTSNQGSLTPTRFETSNELRGLATRLEDLSIGPVPRIGVSG
ncbi:hypothetical protein E4U21_004896 [Claviceps maximensis]|nr:hypothetical protein E4U21_004896 [Claviceps maximensis]